MPKPNKSEYLDRLRRSFTIAPPGKTMGIEHNSYLILPKSAGVHKKGYKLIGASEKEWKFEFVEEQ